MLRSDANLGGYGVRRHLAEDYEVDGGRCCRVAPPSSAVCPPPTATSGPSPTRTRSCLGQSLARAELQVLLKALLHKLPSLDLAVPVTRLRQIEGITVGGLLEVPVRW